MNKDNISSIFGRLDNPSNLLNYPMYTVLIIHTLTVSDSCSLLASTAVLTSIRLGGWMSKSRFNHS